MVIQLCGQPPQPELRTGRTALILSAICEEYRTLLVLRDIQHPVRAGAVQRRADPVQVTCSDNIPVSLVIRNGLPCKCLLFLRHILRLQFHAQSSCTGYIETKFYRRHISGLVIRHR